MKRCGRCVWVMLVACLVAGGVQAQVAASAPVAPAAADVFRKAYDAHAAGRYEQAAQMFAFGLQSEPRNAEAWYLLGGAKLALADLDGARMAWQQALGLSEGLGRVRVEDALAYLGRLEPGNLKKLGMVLDTSALKISAQKLARYHPVHDRKYRIEMAEEFFSDPGLRKFRVSRKGLERCGTSLPLALSHANKEWGKGYSEYVFPLEYYYRSESMKCAGRNLEISPGGFFLAGAVVAGALSNKEQTTTARLPPVIGDEWVEEVGWDLNGVRTSHYSACRVGAVDKGRWPNALIDNLPGNKIQVVCVSMTGAAGYEKANSISAARVYRLFSEEIGFIPGPGEVVEGYGGAYRIVGVAGSLGGVGTALEFKYEQPTHATSVTVGNIRIERIR